jgi:hypothetical protein
MQEFWDQAEAKKAIKAREANLKLERIKAGLDKKPVEKKKHDKWFKNTEVPPEPTEQEIRINRESNAISDYYSASIAKIERQTANAQEFFGRM